MTCSEVEKEKRRAYYQANKDKWKQYYQVGKVKNAEGRKRAKEKHMREKRERVKELARERYWKNRDKVLEQKRRYTRENKEILAQKNKIWRAANKEKLLLQGREQRKAAGPFRAAKAHIDRVYKKFPAAITNDGSENPEQLELWMYVMRDRPCPHCNGPVDHIDHIVPLAAGGPHAWSNLRMLCKYCNMAKYDRSEEDFIGWLDRLVAFRTKGANSL